MILTNKIGSIEVASKPDDAYWTVDRVDIYDDEHELLTDIDPDYSQINQPFEHLEDMLQRVADYFKVDVSVVTIED
jgi:hypothetical protein